MENPSVPVAPAHLLVKNPREFLKIGDSSWYRIPAHLRPQPVVIPGLGKRWRVSDLLAWVEGLATASTRKKRKPAVPVDAELEPAEA